MKKFLCIFISLLTMATSHAQQKNVELKIVETSDIHGMFFPTDFASGKRVFGTMARISSYIKRQRANYGDNLILLDNGDILQGQPTNYFSNFVDTENINIAAAISNYLKYDAQGIGNHDLETGHACYDKWIKELNCPVLAANMINTSTGEPYAQPYKIIEREGLKIAILGMITPAIPYMLGEQVWSGIRFEDIVSSSKKWVKKLKEEEKADFIIGLFHSGYDGGIATSDYKEHEAKDVAEEVEGFDAIMCGHDHKVFCGGVETKSGNTCVLINPGMNGRQIAEIQISLIVENGKVKDSNINAETVQMDPESVDQEFMSHFEKEIKSVEAFCNEKIGTLAYAMFTREGFFGSSPFTDLIHNLQLSATKADISFSSPLMIDVAIKQGDLTIADMFKLYKYEDKLYVMNMTGEEIQKYLEMSYALWTNQMHSAKDRILLLDESDPSMITFKNAFENFDSAAGIDYEVDVTKPEGQKIKILQMSNGEPFSASKTYKVAMNSYRANGAGELITKGAGIAKEKLKERIVSISAKDQRQMITDVIKSLGKIEPKANNNWKFVPESMAKAALARDREAIFKHTVTRVF